MGLQNRVADLESELEDLKRTNAEKIAGKENVSDVGINVNRVLCAYVYMLHVHYVCCEEYKMQIGYCVTQ